MSNLSTAQADTLSPHDSILQGNQPATSGKLNMMVSYHQGEGSYPDEIHVPVTDLLLPTFLQSALPFTLRDP